MMKIVEVQESNDTAALKFNKPRILVSYECDNIQEAHEAYEYFFKQYKVQEIEEQIFRSKSCIKKDKEHISKLKKELKGIK